MQQQKISRQLPKLRQSVFHLRKLQQKKNLLKESDIMDEMYEKAEMHNEKGAWQMIFGVNTLPAYRRNGYAGELIRRAIYDAKQQGRKGLVLTCKEKLVSYYAKFGFLDEGVSEKSTHGNAEWHQMRLAFDNRKLTK